MAAGVLESPSHPLPGLSLASESSVTFAGKPAPPYDDLIERALLVWTSLIGTISSEVFGHLNGAVTDEDRFFDRCVAMTARIAGLAVPMTAAE